MRFRSLSLLFVATCGALSPVVAESDVGDLLRALHVANDAHVRVALERGASAERDGGFTGARGAAAQIASLACAYTSPPSAFHRAPTALSAMERLARAMRSEQHSDGLWSIGNIDSPPDSAFALKLLCAAQRLLRSEGADGSAGARALLEELILSAAEGVRTGGVHTPNHRWQICATLAAVHELYPDRKWVARIDDWLGEGLDLDGDGQWSERSPNYNAEVNNPSLIDLAVLLDRPALLEPVRRNLELTLFHAEPNGEIDAVASRRQDQRPGLRIHLHDFYLSFRYLALRDRNGVFAAVARRVEDESVAEMTRDFRLMIMTLAGLLTRPGLLAPLPTPQPLPDDYAKLFAGSSTARIRRGGTTATIYGGSDWFAGLGVGSGLATNPTFFKFRKGAAILDSVRMTPAFFNTGFFYSRGLNVGGQGYALSQTLAVPYHLPLPAERRNANGDYALAADMAAQGILGRFFSKMDFARRPSQFRTLRSVVAVSERNGGFDLAFEIDGTPNVPITIELAFRAGGSLRGVATMLPALARERGTRSRDDDDEVLVLKEGFGSYTVGADTIEFGPGQVARAPGRMEGEIYQWVSGSLPAEGIRVYLTGMTPFKHTLTFK